MTSNQKTDHEDPYKSQTTIQNVMATFNDKDKNDLNLDKVTPELAAKIVKHFVLPMFDNAPSSNYGRRIGQKGIAQGGSVYQELKLSEQLTNELAKVREEVNNTRQRLEQEAQLRMDAQTQLRQLKKQLKLVSKKYELLRTAHAESTRVNQMYKDYVSQLDVDYEVLLKLSNQNELQRKRMGQDL